MLSFAFIVTALLFYLSVEEEKDVAWLLLGNERSSWRKAS
jgi:hypothetical protein